MSLVDKLDSIGLTLKLCKYASEKECEWWLDGHRGSIEWHKGFCCFHTDQQKHLLAEVNESGDCPRCVMGDDTMPHRYLECVYET